MTPRGIRNNNPLNIRRTGKDQWKGMKAPSNSPKKGMKAPSDSPKGGENKAQGYDKAFVQFETMEWGWRAAFHLLTRNYYQKHGLNTIRGIVSRWAPPQDHNNTEAYIRNVSRRTGIPADEPLGNPTEQPARWLLLGAAMAIQECGTDSLDYLAMLRGWELLGAK